jgi:hypothetical protein
MPALFVVTCCLTPVSLFVSTTFAPDSRAPVESLTVPLIEAADCARSTVDMEHMRRKRRIAASVALVRDPSPRAAIVRLEA